MSAFTVARLAALGLVVSLVSGCASTAFAPSSAVPSREALDRFSLEGRFSLSQDSKNYSGRLRWTYRGVSSELLLSSPFGQGIAEIVTDARGAQLKTGDGKVFSAPDADTLTQEVLGYSLPLGLLADWVRGRVASGNARFDAQGRAIHLRQDTWEVDYEYSDSDPGAPPVRIVARREGVLELRVFVQEWHSLAVEETAQ